MRAPLVRKAKAETRETLLTMRLSRAVWQIVICTYGGQARIDTRSYWGQEDDLKPTKAGFVLTLAEVDDFIDALQRGRAKLVTLNRGFETGDKRAI